MAYMWFNLAVVHFPASETRNRNVAIKNRDVVAGKLSREEVAESQKLAREWRPSDRSGTLSLRNPKSLTDFGTTFVLFVPADAQLGYRLVPVKSAVSQGFDSKERSARLRWKS
jgi:hypothetical protein